MGCHMGTKGVVLGGGSYISAGKVDFALAIIDLDAAAPEAELLSLGFLAHGLTIDPLDATRAALFEKQGPGACVVDLARRRVVAPIPTTPTRKFYGHGAFSSDGSLLYATESLVDRAFEGALVVRDARTLAELGLVPTHGVAPHDCQLIDDGTTMVVANGGGPLDGAAPSVTFVDLASGRLLEHVAVTPGGDLAVVSAPRDGSPNPNRELGAVTLRPRGGDAVTMDRPAQVVQRMLGETLSVVVHEVDGVVLATHPLGDCVSMWRLADASFLGTLELSGPRGVAISLDGAWSLVSHMAGRSVRLTAFSTTTSEPVGVYVDPSFTSGSHIHVHAL